MIVPIERDLVAESEYASRLCVIGSFPRSGSHWTRRMLAEIVARKNGLASGAEFGPGLNRMAGFAQPFEQEFWKSFEGPIFVAAHNLNEFGRQFLKVYLRRDFEAVWRSTQKAQKESGLSDCGEKPVESKMIFDTGFEEIPMVLDLIIRLEF